MAYFRLDTTDVFATRIGRIYSARPAAATEMPNGVFGTVGDLETGEEWLLCLTGPTISAGYYNNEKSTKKSL